MEKNIVFSKAPIRDVIFEIKFAPDLSVACKRDEFYNEIRDIYSEIVLPKIDFAKNSFDQPTQYINTDKSKIITCSAQSFSFGTNKYKSFTVFKKECIELISLFHKKYPSLTSIRNSGFRYINHIPVERKENKINLADYLNFNFCLPPSLNSKNLEFFQNSYFLELEKETTGIKVNINSIKDDQKKDFLILDFDLMSVKLIPFDEVEKYLVDFHKKIEDIFLDIITAAYKKSIE